MYKTEKAALNRKIFS